MYLAIFDPTGVARRPRERIDDCGEKDTVLRRHRASILAAGSEAGGHWPPGGEVNSPLQVNFRYHDYRANVVILRTDGSCRDEGVWISRAIGKGPRRAFALKPGSELVTFLAVDGDKGWGEEWRAKRGCVGTDSGGAI